ncbi:MAG: undecaprenyl-diphosphatase UppP [Anaerolineales bacterium]|nr:undecaprenyl-diphosphatase UppP [Anaerolineales bacterium]
MTILQSIILGIIQGITEFVPISSSGHLVLTPFIFQWELPATESFIFNILVQVASLIAVFVYFKNDLINIIRATFLGIIRREPFAEIEARLGWYIIIATIPAGLVGFLLKDQVESAFGNPLSTSLFMLGTAFLLTIAEKVGRRNRGLNKFSWIDALTMGIFQILAIFPGISRSGATITGAMIRNLDRPSAARFSFLMSIPIMLAAGALTFLDFIKIPHLTDLLPSYIPGFFASAISGYLAIRWLLAFLTRYPLFSFAIYCSIFGIINLLLVFLGH